MDVLALAAHDLPIALAPLGTAIGERQIVEILRLHEAPVFCFDGDRAGKQAAWRALERMLPVLKAEHSPKFLYLPEGEDPDSLVDKEGGEAFAARINNESRPVLETWLAGLENIAGSGADGRARMAKKADAMLSTMQDDYLRQAWRQEVEKKTGITLQRQSSRAPQQPAGTARQAAARIPVNMTQEIFLAGLVQKPSRFRELPAEARDFLLDSEPLRLFYSRAFSLAGFEAEKNGRFAGQLQNEFPDQSISRWINQEPVSDLEFAGVVLAMQISYKKHIMTQVRDLAARTNLGREIRTLEEKRRAIDSELNNRQEV